jgi:hypothetical protein
MDPAGVFATSFARDQALIRTGKQGLALALFLLFLLILPELVGPRIVAVATAMLLTAVVAVGLQIWAPAPMPPLSPRRPTACRSGSRSLSEDARPPPSASCSACPPCGSRVSISF